MAKKSRADDARVRFTKMHGIGNDFVVIDAVTQKVTLSSQAAAKIADRHFGVGCDQILLVEPPSDPNMDFRYRIFNQDGGEVEQCGNGARCFAKFVRDKKLTHKREIDVETLAGAITIQANKDQTFSVDMGKPIFAPSDIPLAVEDMQPTYQLNLGEDFGKITFSALSMGNPHAVIEVDDISHASVAALGARLETDPAFPQRVNVGFSQILARDTIKLRVWERGVGETLACGTGACAAVVAGIMLDQLDSKVKVTLLGGDLNIEWPGGDHPVRLTGPATTVFHGQIRL